MSLVDGVLLPRVRHAERARAVAAVPYVAILVAGAIAFLPGLGAGFVSDDFDYLWWFRSTPLSDIVALFVPSAPQGRVDPYYRPLSDLLFWVEYQVFGSHPAAYHVVALACHLAIAFLLYRLAVRLGVRTAIALAGVAAFLLSIHAHEVVFWWADDHYAFGGLAIVAAVLAYAEGWTWLSVACAVLALLTDEAGVTLLPTLAVYEALFGGPIVASAGALGRRALRLAPTVAAVVGYAGMRLAGGGFWGEAPACRNPGCLASGAVEYFDQLFVRPGRLIELLRAGTSSNRLVVGAALLGLLVVGAALLRVWRWRDWRVVAFGAGWCAISAAVLIYGLWPYVSDRFFYYPEIGLALAVAGGLEQALQGSTSAARPARAAAGVVLAVYAAWLAVGVLALWNRAEQWDAAGRTVSAIFDGTVRLEPHPPPGAVLVFEDVPDTLLPDVPPGNTGPYLLRNGLTTGLRGRYGRSDIRPIPATSPLPPGSTTVVCLDINDGAVVRAACPR
jgi:hypothetical protein